MKRVLFILALLIGLYSCDEDSVDMKGTAVFNNSIIEQSLKSGSVGNVDDIAFAVVTIESIDGTTVYSNEKIELFKLNNQILSLPIELIVGNYKLVNFYLVDNDNNVLFIAPKEGSEKARFVANPLAIDFNIIENEETKTNVEVLTVKDEVPQAFGYSEFEVSFVETFAILVSLFEYSEAEGMFVLSNGSIEISGEDFCIHDTLAPVNNAVSILENKNSYTVSISKNGVEYYNYTFSIDSIKQHSIETINPIKVYVDGDKILILQPGSDTGKDARIVTHLRWTNEPASGLNFGGAAEFAAIAWTDGGQSDVRGLIDFDLSMLNVQVISEAKLYLTAVGDLSFCIGASSHSQLSGSNESYLSQITSAWEEDVVTWDSQPTISSVNQILMPASDNDMQNYVVDVTDFINKELSNPNDYHGFMIHLVTEEYYRRLHFGSSDAPDSATHPKLVLKY